MIYRLSFFSHHYFTLRGSSGAALLSRSSHEINDGGEERVCQTDLTLAWMIYWSAIRKWDFSFDVFAHSWLTIYPLQIRNAEYNIG